MVSRSDLNGKRVLVTGASGFTGRYMVEELRAQGCHIVALSGQGAASAADDHVVADLTDAAAVTAAVAEARADIVVHLAALAFVGHGKVEDFYSVNLMGHATCSLPWTKPGIVPNTSCWPAVPISTAIAPAVSWTRIRCLSRPTTTR